MNNPGVQQPVKLPADVVGNAWNRLLAAAKDLGAFKTVFAVLASSAGAYVVGGIVLALRLSQARFPVQASLDVIPPSVLLVAGVRDLLLSAIIALLLCGLMLAATVWLPDWCAFLVPGLLLLIVPLNLGGLAWPVGLCVLGVLFWRSKARMERDRTWVPPVGLIASVCAVVVLGLTLARYTCRLTSTRSASCRYAILTSQTRGSPPQGATSALQTISSTSQVQIARTSLATARSWLPTPATRCCI